MLTLHELIVKHNRRIHRMSRLIFALGERYIYGVDVNLTERIDTLRDTRDIYEAMLLDLLEVNKTNQLQVVKRDNNIYSRMQIADRYKNSIPLYRLSMNSNLRQKLLRRGIFYREQLISYCADKSLLQVSIDLDLEVYEIESLKYFVRFK